MISEPNSSGTPRQRTARLIVKSGTESNSSIENTGWVVLGGCIGVQSVQISDPLEQEIKITPETPYYIKSKKIFNHFGISS